MGTRSIIIVPTMISTMWMNGNILWDQEKHMIQSFHHHFDNDHHHEPATALSKESGYNRTPRLSFQEITAKQYMVNSTYLSFFAIYDELSCNTSLQGGEKHECTLHIAMHTAMHNAQCNAQCTLHNAHCIAVQPQREGKQCIVNSTDCALHRSIVHTTMWKQLQSNTW